MATEIIISARPKAILTYDILMTGRENTSDAFDDILFAMKYSRFNFCSFVQN